MSATAAAVPLLEWRHITCMVGKEWYDIQCVRVFLIWRRRLQKVDDYADQDDTLETDKSAYDEGMYNICV